MTIQAITLRVLRMPLVRPFETTYGRLTSRHVLLVCMEAEGVVGWGEIVASDEPRYSYETIGTARTIVGRHFAPALLHDRLTTLDDLVRRLAGYRGHPMARAGLELAWVDLVARLQRRSIAEVIGGTRRSVPVGVSLGFEPSPEILVDQVERHVALGYRRIKLKITRGWDLEIVRLVRSRFPTLALWADANATYTLADADHLRRLDAFDLALLEQPLDSADLLDHARLQAQLLTGLCLDESIGGVRQAAQALELSSCRSINIKIGRVGGYSQALAIHDHCQERDVPVWCGGRLESGIGRAHNLALAALPNFTLPGDISASRRYFAHDLVAPVAELDGDGGIAVPCGVGLGVEVDVDRVTHLTEASDRFEREVRSVPLMEN